MSRPPSPRRMHVGAVLLLLAAGAAVPAWRLASALVDAPAAPGVPATQPKKPKADPVEAFFASGRIPRLRIVLPPESIQALGRNPRAYVRATVRDMAADRLDIIYADVGVHLKGSAGSFRGLGDKPALTLNFNKFYKGQKYHGLEKVSLNNSVQDPSYLCESVGSLISRQAGVPAARISHARVWVNDRDWGFYVLKEGFDDPFFRHFFGDDTGTFYECRPAADVDQLVQKNHPEDKERAALKQFVAATREKDPTKRRAALEKVLDVERFHSMLAVDSFIAHWDGYAGNRNNYRVYHDPRAGRMVFLPHGMDQLFQNTDYPLFAGAGMIANLLTQSAEDKARYLDRVIELRAKVFDPEAIGRHIDQTVARTAPVLAEINPALAKQHEEMARQLKQRVAQRARSIDRQIASIPRPLMFDSAGIASLAASAWSPQVQGNAVAERIEEGGKPVLRIRAERAGAVASFRTGVHLSRGRYVFEGRCRSAGIAAPDAPGMGAGLRISGGQRTSRLVGAGDWQAVEFAFEVAEDSREVVLVAELRADAGEARFDPATLRLRKASP